MGGEAQVTVFADTNLGTRIAFNAPSDITAASLKSGGFTGHVQNLVFFELESSMKWFVSNAGYDMKDNRCNDSSAGDFEKAHLSCLPDIGEIQVNGLMVKRKSFFYYLPDAFPIKFAFPAMRGTWFLHVEVKHLKCLCTPRSPCDEDVLSKHKDLMICKGDKAKCNSEEKEEHEITNLVSKKQEGNEISHENHAQNEATGMSERHPCIFGDKPTSMAKTSYVMPENKFENLVELHANSIQGSHSKMSTQLISITGSQSRKLRIGARLLSASQDLGVSITKHDPKLPFRILKDRKLLQGKSQMKGSIFSISGSDDD
ncbi:hypothetical protein ACSQ67_020221 [Phaseolus vulgaris]